MPSHTQPPSSDPPSLPRIAQPTGQPYTETREFGHFAVLAMLAVGALLGAGSALLLAPESGERTRRNIRRRVGSSFRRLTGREKSTWARLKRALDRAAAGAEEAGGRE